MISSPSLSPLDQRLQLPNGRKIFAIYALTLLMYTVASPDPDPNTRGEGQLLNSNECNSTLTSGTSSHLYHKKSCISPREQKWNFTGRTLTSLETAAV